MSKVMKIDAGLDTWLHYRPSVGVDSLHIVGLPGSGKSNMAHGLLNQCIKKGEIAVMPGDRFCEWRHYPYNKLWKERGWKIKVLVPKGVNIFYHNFEKNEWFEDVDLMGVNVLEYFKEDPDLKLLVIYDQHLTRADRANYWVMVLKQLLNRTTFIDEAVLILFHEAGILYPEMVKGKEHWEAIYNFSELFVETRKGLVRTIFLSQIKSEIDYTIRKKCLFKIFRKCWPGRDEPVPVQKCAPFQAINQYTIVRGGLYVMDNTIEYFKENKEIWKMIPDTFSINGNSPNNHNKKASKRLQCSNCGYEWKPKVSNPLSCPKCKHYFNQGYNEVEEVIT